MDRVVRLYQLWSWLPHFRAVAETEHLPTASEALGLSPSALSRALKQLEANVGRDLFVRDGRTIRLNSSGEELLRAVRKAMQGIDDALQALATDSIPIQLRVAAPGAFHGALFLDLIASLAKQYPRLRVDLCSCPASEIIPRLCQGRIDVCVHEGGVQHPDLKTTELGRLAKVVACSSQHPLAGKHLRIAELANQNFAAPPPDAQGLRADGWPAGCERRVHLSVAHMQTGIDACRSGQYLAVLPRLLVESNGLEELQITDFEPSRSPLFATYRTPVGAQSAEFSAFLAGLQGLFHDHCV